MKKYFLSNGFKIVYDKDLDVPVADGFYFTISYPGMSGRELLQELLSYGISAITLDITGSEKKEGLRACVSMVPTGYVSRAGKTAKNSTKTPCLKIKSYVMAKDKGKYSYRY